METDSEKESTEKHAEASVVLKPLYFPPMILWQLLAYFIGYRIERMINEAVLFPNGFIYYVCPKCNITLEREFMPYCSRCGQHLCWDSYEKSKVIHPGAQK
ncbi:MAG: hypothetical protein IKL92_04630 [Oscillospiraceae bacterium]|nr:hypothetical protein [Oscillospiraceae bacterium]